MPVTSEFSNDLAICVTNNTMPACDRVVDALRNHRASRSISVTLVHVDQNDRVQQFIDAKNVGFFLSIFPEVSPLLQQVRQAFGDARRSDASFRIKHHEVYIPGFTGDEVDHAALPSSIAYMLSCCPVFDKPVIALLHQTATINQAKQEAKTLDSAGLAVIFCDLDLPQDGRENDVLDIIRLDPSSHSLSTILAWTGTMNFARMHTEHFYIFNPSQSAQLQTMRTIKNWHAEQDRVAASATMVYAYAPSDTFEHIHGETQSSSGATSQFRRGSAMPTAPFKVVSVQSVDDVVKAVMEDAPAA